MLRLNAIALFSLLSCLSMFSNQIFGVPLIGLDFALLLALHLLFASLWGFLKSGGNVITPLSLIFLALVITLGFGAVFRVLGEKYNEYDVAVILGVLCSVIVLLLTRERFPHNPVNNFLKMRNALSPHIFGIVTISIYAIFFMLYLYDEVLELFWAAVLGLFPAVFLLGAIYALKKKLKSFSFFLGVTCLISIWMYYRFVFSGGGRINIAATLLAVVTVASWVWPSRLYKISILVIAPFALTWASVIELTRYQSIEMQVSVDATQQAFGKGAGLTSVLAPYDTLVDIVSLSGIWGVRPFLEWIDQVVFTIFFWVPRVWWPNKPEGFGKMIVYELQPDLGSTTYTMAASVFGEFVYYAGMLGPGLALVMIILFVSIINKALNWAGRTSSSIWMIHYALFAYMSAQGLTLIWGGLASYAPRGLAAMFGLSAVLCLWLFFRSFSVRAQI